MVWINRLLLFPAWYYFYSWGFWYKFSLRSVIMVYDALGVWPVVSNLLAPFRRDKTFAGYLVGIVVRVFWMLMSLVILTIVVAVMVSAMLLFYAGPLLVYWFLHYSYLVPYIFIAFMLYLYLEARQAYWVRVKKGILSPELARQIWKRLELNSDEAHMVYTEKGKEMFIQLLHKHELNEEDFLSTKDWVLRQEYNKQAWKYWQNDFFYRRKGVDLGWAAGFIPELKKVSIDLTIEASGGHLPHIYGREREIEKILQTLRSPVRNNVLLVGEAGVGKTSMVYALAWLIIGRKAGINIPSLETLLKPLEGKRIVELHAAGLIGGTSGRGDLERRLNVVLHELKEGETILFINQLEILIQSGLVGYMTPLLSSTRFPIIATTTPEVFRDSLSKLPEMITELEVIQMKPPSVSETIRILQGFSGSVEKKYRIIYTYPALHGAAELSERYIHNSVLPDKAIKVLARAAENRTDNVINLKDVQDVVTQVSNVPVGDLDADETNKLLNLEHLLQKQIVGQEEAVRDISRAVRRARTGVGSKERPIAVFLFIGPTGVGKTLTAKTLAQVYFTPHSSSITSEVELSQLVERCFVRFDMSEFSEVGSVQNFIERMTREIVDKPFALVLLDEMEKSEREIHNLFLQIFEDGRLTDELGKTVDFRNTIIIATSNAVTHIPEGEVAEEYIQSELFKVFRPELINRFDGIVLFHPLRVEDMNRVVSLELNNLKKRMKDSHEVDLTWNDQLSQELAKLGYDPKYGARPLRRIIQDHIEDALAQKLLRKEIQSGDNYQLTTNELQ